MALEYTFGRTHKEPNSRNSGKGFEDRNSPLGDVAVLSRETWLLRLPEAKMKS